MMSDDQQWHCAAKFYILNFKVTDLDHNLRAGSPNRGAGSGIRRDPVEFNPCVLVAAVRLLHVAVYCSDSLASEDSKWGW